MTEIHQMLEVEKLAMEEESIKCELNRNKTELYFRQDNLNKLKSDTQAISDKVTVLEQSYDETQHKIDCLKSILDATRTSSMHQSVLKKMIEKSQPTIENQTEKLHMFKESYSRMLSKYEESPIYYSILESEAEEKKLSELINDKRNEMMKLETQQEY